VRADPEARANAERVFAAVRERAGGRCEECDASGGSPIHLLEGVPSETDTLFLCETCAPIVAEELGAIVHDGDFRAAVMRRLRR
jgi:hypothetical protein